MKNFDEETKKILQELERVTFGQVAKYNSKEVNQAFISLKDLIKKHTLTKEEFRGILCEFPPSIAEDSLQPEWTQGEMDTVWDFIVGKRKYIFKE